MGAPTGINRAIGPVFECDLQCGKSIANLVGNRKILRLPRFGSQLDHKSHQRIGQTVAGGNGLRHPLAEQAEYAAQLFQ